MSVGYPINVYQESINQYLQEYLVNFDYVVRIMEDYGFVPVFKSECIKMGLPDSAGMFSELYANMENETKRNQKAGLDYGKAQNMTAEEKQISFMNRYFIFKKVRNVNTDKIAKIVEQQNKMAESIEEVITQDIQEMERAHPEITVPSIAKPLVRKIKKPKIILEKYSQSEDEPVLVQQETVLVQSEPVLVQSETMTVVQQEPMLIKIKKPTLKIIS
jgi:hypothetical protein